MTKEEAVKVLEQVAAKMIGTLQDHKLAQEALKIIREEKKEE